MLKTLRSLLAVAVLLLAGGAPAADDAAVLESLLAGMRAVEAPFSQTQTDETGAVLQSSSGRMWLRRADAEGQMGQFRWNYETPYLQEVVCDGARIWVYDKDLAQVTVRSAQEALGNTPAALLSQQAGLSKAFTVAAEGGEGGVQRFLLKPKSAEGDFSHIELWMKGSAPQRMKFHDALGGATEIGFAGAKLNQPAAEGLFRFVPPKGVEVVETGSAQ